MDHDSELLPLNIHHSPVVWTGPLVIPRRRDPSAGSRATDRSAYAPVEDSGESECSFSAPLVSSSSPALAAWKTVEARRETPLRRSGLTGREITSDSHYLSQNRRLTPVVRRPWRGQHLFSSRIPEPALNGHDESTEHQ